MEYRQNYRTINFPLKFSTHTCSQVLMCVKFFMELYAYENIIMDRVQAAARRRLSPRHSQGRMTRDWVMPRYNVSLTHDKIQATVNKPSARFMFIIACKYSSICTKRTQFSPTTIKQITWRLSLWPQKMNRLLVHEKNLLRCATQ